MDTLRDEALGYARRGWPVFPVSRSKRPMLKAWPERATTDPMVVWTWWERWPRASIGTPTGRAFDTVDCDGLQARAELERLCELAGHAFHGPLMRTGRGWQMFYSPTGLGNRNPSLPGVDYRGLGGFTILPPSIHPSGAVYTWLRAPGEFPDMPPALAEALWPPRDPPAIGSRSTKVASPGSWAARALEAIGRELAGVQAGMGLRNAELNRLAFRAFQLVPLVSEEEVEAAILEAAEANGYVSSHGLARTQSTIASARVAGLAQPRTPGGQP